MTVRRINYTGRKRIARDDCDISLNTDENGRLSYDIKLSLESYNFPPESRLFVEAYHGQAKYQRFALGTVGVLSLPDDRTLRLFTPDDPIRFRVKVIDTTALEGRLLGEADKIRPIIGADIAGSRISLLPVKGDDLEQEAWRLSFDYEPVLLVNNRYGDWRQFVRSPAFFWLVLPEVFRQVLKHIMVDEEHFDTDDPSDVMSQWLVVAQSLPGVDELPDSSADRPTITRWIDDATEAFARHHRLGERFGPEVVEG